MICPTCNGTGHIDTTTEANVGFRTKRICEDCGGCGIAHCCEGHQPPPWTPDNPRSDDPTMCRCGATAKDPYCYCDC